TVGKSMGAIERSVEQAKNALSSLGLGIGLGAAMTQVTRLADEYTKFTAQLRLASNSQREYAQSMADVQRIAKTAQADIGATGVLYARITSAMRDLGTSQAQVANITETVNLAL